MHSFLAAAVAAALPTTLALAAAWPGPTPASAGAQVTSRVDAMPLRRGYYVSSDTRCADASRATVTLFKGNGFNLTCETVSIERLSRSTYRLRERCSDHEGGADMESTQVYELYGETAFSIIGEDGSNWSARLCRQDQMPWPFSTNDISDITG